MSRNEADRTLRIRNHQTGKEWEGSLEAYWEAHLDPISDDYTPKDASATELFLEWTSRVEELHPNGLVPIYWYVRGPRFKIERMPFQMSHEPKELASIPDFLTHYGWPMSLQTGEPLNWLTLRVVDKRWNAEAADKGGFIQEATGWKPSILQPHLFLPALINARR